MHSQQEHKRHRLLACASKGDCKISSRGAAPFRHRDSNSLTWTLQVPRL